MYVGYMYGTSGSLINNRTNKTSSSIKKIVDNWYSGSLNTKTDTSGNIYDKYVSRTAIYCNDRSGESYTIHNSFKYAGERRLVESKQPSYKCGNNPSGSLYGDVDNADRFSASTSITYSNGVEAGNGKLTYPVALLTADEVVFAGGLWYTKSPTWCSYNSIGGSVTGISDWWTMTPRGFTTVQRYSHMFRISTDSYAGAVTWTQVDYTSAVRPVLSLKSCTTWSKGDGSSNNPYEVSIDSTCASRDN